MNPQKTKPLSGGTSERNRPVEKVIEDGICSAAKVGWNVVKWVAPKAGRIFTNVAMRGGKAAASTPAGKVVVRGAEELARGSGRAAVGVARWAGKGVEDIFTAIGLGVLGIVLLIVGAVIWAFFSTPRTPDSDPTREDAPMSSVTPAAVPAPAFEPSPAITTPKPEPALQFATELEAQKAAVLLYPELGVAGSVFNKAFVAEVHRRKQTNPDFFRSTDWPVQLANEMAPGQKPASSGAFDR